MDYTFVANEGILPEARGLSRRSRSRTRLMYTRTVSGGFATVQPGSQLSINAVEGYSLEDFSAEVSNGEFLHLVRCTDRITIGGTKPDL